MSWVLDARRARSDRASLLRALRVPLAGLTALTGVGVVGLMLIEGWSFADAVYMVIITISTIGYGEVRPLSPDGRLFMIGFIVLGLGLATRFLSVAARLVVDGDLLTDLVTRRRARELVAMQHHFVVIGYGRLGREIVADLAHHGAEVVVIDRKEPASAPDGVRVVVGDATDDDVLDLAGVKHARGLAIATPSDAVNVYVTLSARQLAPDLHIVTRLEDEAARGKALKAGANAVLLPFHTSGSRMAQAMMRPGSSAFVEHATLRHFDDLLMEDVRLVDGSELVGGTLRELDMRSRYGVIVVAIRRPGLDHLVTPGPDDDLRPGDLLVVVGPPAAVRGFLEAARTPHA